jgi:hypothetical protein
MPFLGYFFFSKTFDNLSHVAQLSKITRTVAYTKNMKILNDDCKRYHKLEYHSRAFSYTPRVINYAPIEH